MRLARLIPIVSVLGLLAGQTRASTGVTDDWPTWRGPLGTGESRSADPPVTWSEEKNVRWKVAIPGRGKGSPIVLGDMVYVLSAEGFGDEVKPPEPEGGGRGGRSRGLQPTQKQRFQLIALDRADGSVAWKSTAIEGLPHEGTHGDGSWASASAVTDGEHIFAHFGSNGLFAFDLKGKKLWEKQLGKMKTRNGFGEGSSPAVHGDTLVVQWYHEGPDFFVALDKKTGKEKWRQERDEPTGWATPIIVEVKGKAQVISNGTNEITAFDLKSGKIVWTCGGMTTNAIPSPVHADGTVYVTSGFRGSALVAIDLAKAKGDVTGTDVVLWTHDKDTPYVPSPLLYDDTLYFLKSNSGVLSAFDVKSGERLFGPQRLESVANAYASPVAAAGRIYLVGRDGETEVLKHGAEYEVLASNTLDDAFDASPALVDGEIYLRGEKHLYCIAAGGDSDQTD